MAKILQMKLQNLQQPNENNLLKFPNNSNVNNCYTPSYRYWNVVGYSHTSWALYEYMHWWFRLLTIGTLPCETNSILTKDFIWITCSIQTVETRWGETSEQWMWSIIHAQLTSYKIVCQISGTRVIVCQSTTVIQILEWGNRVTLAVHCMSTCTH